MKGALACRRASFPPASHEEKSAIVELALFFWAPRLLQGAACGEPLAAQKTQGKKMPALRLAKEGFCENR